jgi:hypothetical protein
MSLLLSASARGTSPRRCAQAPDSPMTRGRRPVANLSQGPDTLLSVVTALPSRHDIPSASRHLQRLAAPAPWGAAIRHILARLSHPTPAASDSAHPTDLVPRHATVARLG